MRDYIFAILPAILLTVAAHAAADDEKIFVRILTCNLAGDNTNFSSASKELETQAKADGNGGYQIAGPFRLGEVCIENARFSGAFGVFVATARLCDERSKPLLDFLKTAQGQLKPAALPPLPGVISALEAPNYGLFLFHGEPGMGGNADPASKHMSYICTYKGSGPQ